MQEASRARVSVEGGVEGDFRGKPGPRQVVVLGREGFEAACAALGASLPWTLRRANLYVEGLDLRDSVGARIAIGSVLLEITEECEPCFVMDRMHDGLRSALAPEWRGGVACRVLRGGEIAAGDAVALESADAYERLVELEGCFNCRDLGGYRAAGGRRVRRGRVYRSDALHRLTARDVAQLRDGIGIRTVIDLRSTPERRAEPHGAIAAAPVRVHHLPLFDGERSGERPPMTLDQTYFALLGVAREPIARIVRLIADDPAPALFHCAAGKDRTGLVAAVLLGAVGVAEQDVIEDYAATRRSLARIVERLRASDAYQYVFAELPPDTLHAEPATMESLLARVADAHGSMRDYLLASGVDDATLARLEEQLLEPA